MANNIYGATSLTGGSAGALDAIDGAILVDSDAAIVLIKGGNVYFYVLNASLGQSEVSPTIIVPNSNAGTKCWVLTQSYSTSGDFSGYSYLIPWGLSDVTTAQNITSDATLQSITGLSQDGLLATKRYLIEANICVANTATNGIKLAFATTNTLTTSNFICTGISYDVSGSIVKYSRVASASVFTGLLCNETAIVNFVTIKGWITVGTGGTLILKVAQNTSHADTLSILPGSYMHITQVHS